MEALTAFYSSFRTFYSEGPYGGYVRGLHRLGEHGSSVLEIAQPAGSFPDAPNPDFVIAMALSGGFRTVADKGTGRFTTRMRPGLLGITPPNVATQFEIDARSRFLILTVDDTHARDVLDRAAPGFTDFGRLHAMTFRDEFVATLLYRLWNEARDPEAGSLLADSAIVTLLHALLRRSRQVKGPVRATARLAPWQLRRATDYIVEHIAEDISLADVSAHVGLSCYHFARAFKSSTGLPPHRYLVRRRIERARELLTEGTSSITEIALDCGFGSSQHLATVFRRIVGTTPTAYRRDRRC